MQFILPINWFSPPINATVWFISLCYKEIDNGLNPDDPNDRNNTDDIGYTMLENSLNSIDNL